MLTISVFDMFKIGVGPSSSHTLCPWRIVQRFERCVMREARGVCIARVRFELLGSLALTGRARGEYFRTHGGVLNHRHVANTMPCDTLAP